MKIKNVTGGILQDTKMGWVFQPGEIKEVDDSDPTIKERVRQLAEHNLVEIVEGKIEEAAVEVKEVVAEEPKAEESTTESKEVEAESEPSTKTTSEEQNSKTESTTKSTKKRSSKKKNE